MEREELLQPALAGVRRPAEAHKPWRPGSLVYPGFFGGALAVGALAYANAVMLRMPRRSLVTIAALALAAEAAVLTAAVLWGDRVIGFGGTVAGLLVFAVAHRMQRSPDRVHHFYSDEDEPHASLFGPGLVASILGRTLEAVLAAAVT